MIVGIGVDVVDLARFDRALTRTPMLRDRLFAQSELEGRMLSNSSLAGRFAAKEALIKCLPDNTGIRWHEMRVLSDAHGSPFFDLSGSVAGHADAAGIDTFHLSISHDAGIATAFVIAERP